MKRGRTLAVVASLALVVTACSGKAPRKIDDPSPTVWLCHPGTFGSPCEKSLATTLVPAAGVRTQQDPAVAAAAPFDCFYVYPTVSIESTDNSDLIPSAREFAIAEIQADPFSQVCRVWAPMYRQRTEASIASKGIGGDPQGDAIAYASLLSAWKDYLAHDNDGRPIIFIGHSQGAAMLIRLLAQQVDPNPALRARVVVAIIAGGNVSVPTGKLVGATFQHLPLCAAPTDTGCVIAYSSYPSEPSADAPFGRPGQGVSLMSGQTTSHGLQVACVNPAAIGGAAAVLFPRYLTQATPPPAPPVTTPWVSFVNLYYAACASSGGASWLQVNIIRTAGDRRNTIPAPQTPGWGFHEDDISLALGNLVNDVHTEELAYSSAAHT